jgi:hypothetical protein
MKKFANGIAQERKRRLWVEKASSRSQSYDFGIYNYSASVVVG